MTNAMTMKNTTETTMNETSKVKTLCFSTASLNDLMTELYLTPSEVVLSEEKEIEVVRMENGREIALEDAFEEIDLRFNVEVDSFDVLDLGDLGIGFVFFLK